MPQVAVHVRFVAHEGRGAELLAEVERMLATARGEEGTLVYAIHVDRDDPDAVVMYELYASEEALEVHGASGAAARFGPLLDDLLREDVVAWFSRPHAAAGLPGADSEP
jgi:quinol monooxygenase YgiN